MEFHEWLEELRNDIKGDLKVDVATHKPTDNELNNIVYLSCKYIAGWPMRTADFAVVKIMGGEPTSVDKLDERFIPALADYLWDHIMGEPDSPTTEQIMEGCKIIRDILFRLDEHTRNDVELEVQ